jgi:hypothetical protein
MTASNHSAPLRTPQGTWARRNIEKARAFAKHLAKVFSHIPQKINQKRKKHLLISWTSPHQLEPPINLHHLKRNVSLGLHPDRRLTWHKKKIIFAKRKQLSISLTKLYWLLGRKSQLTTSNKHLVCKAMLKAIWTYSGVWLPLPTQKFWNVSRQRPCARLWTHLGMCRIWVIQRGLQIPTVKEESATTALIQYLPQRTSKYPNSKPHGATRQRAIAKTPAT